MHSPMQWKTAAKTAHRDKILLLDCTQIFRGKTSVKAARIPRRAGKGNFPIKTSPLNFAVIKGALKLKNGTADIKSK